MSSRDNESRPKRQTNVKKNEKLDLLGNLKKAKKSGVNYKQTITEEDIYEEITEESYQKIVDERQRYNFIEDEYDNGKEVLDESSEEEVKNESIKRTKSMKNCNIRKPKVPKISHEKLPSLFDKQSKASQSSKKIKEISSGLEDLLSEIDSGKSEKKPVQEINPFVNQKPYVRFNMNTSKALPIMMTKKIEPVREYKQITFDAVLPVETKQANTLEDDQKSETFPKENNPNEFDDFDLNGMDFDEPLENIEKGFTYKEEPKTSKSVWLEEVELEKCPPISQSTFSSPSKSTNNVYWIEAYHDKKIPGVVFLFGKTYDIGEKAFVNCCVRIRNLERRLFFLPRTGYEPLQVHEELRVLFAKHNIDSFRCMTVNRKYAFQILDVPDEAEYLMVKYDSKYMELPSDLKGETFSHVFGTNTSCLETLILDLKLKGPCWLNFKNLEPVKVNFSICKLDFEVNGIKGISSIEEKSPPFTVLSLNIKTVINHKTNINEIVCVGGFIHNNIYLDQPPPTNTFQSHFTILTHSKDNVLPYDFKEKAATEWGNKYSISVESNERALINNLLAKLQRLDPDLIVGHSLFGYQMQILLQRCQALNINMWYRLGRLKRSTPLPKLGGKSSSWIEKMVTAGRMICDIAVSARELVKCRSYELHDLVKEILPKEYHGYTTGATVPDLNELFSNSKGVKQLIDLTMDEGVLNLHLMHELQVLPLALQITSICGNLISRTLSSGKSERNEYLLLHAFHEKDYIVPDKAEKSDIKQPDIDRITGEQDLLVDSKRKPKYTGGLVLEPKRGFYENFILLMDFNSLYPSIIREFNVCFTTIDRKKYLQIETDIDHDNPDFVNQQMEILVNLSTEAAKMPPGILPTEIRKLVESRKAVKSLLMAPNLSNEKKMQYDIRQKALKITANSMYGCLGFTQSRFQATELAALVTNHGRNILMKTRDMVSSGSINLNKGASSQANRPNIVLDIIYGDTDSIMVNTGISNPTQYDQVLRIGQRIKEEVNNMYKSIQLDIDGVFRRILLLNKKKYAALLVVNRIKETGKLEFKQELKGLDIVRRDWCKLSAEVGRTVVSKILEGEMSQDDLIESIHTYLQSISTEVRLGRIDLDKFVITKALTKNPEAYSNAEGQPHVQVALRLNAAGSTRQFKAKDTVEYVICEDGTNQRSTQRAFSPSEVLASFAPGSDRQLSIDSNYYLSDQLHPVISRLVDCIDGINSATVAENLGLDPKKYQNRHTLDIKPDDANDNNEEVISGGCGTNFRECRPLVVVCSRCSSKTELARQIGSGGKPSNKSWSCSHCDADMLSSQSEAVRISNQVDVLIRRAIRIYYSSVYVCRELSCKYVCREVTMSLDKKTGDFICPRCRQGEMAPLMSAIQLYNQLSFYMFLFSVKDKVLTNNYQTRMKLIRDRIDMYLKQSKYATINFGEIFGSLFKRKLTLHAARVTDIESLDY